MLEDAGERHAHGAGCGCVPEALTERRSDPGPITVFTQPIDAVIAAALDGVDPALLPDLRIVVSLATLRRRLEGELAHCGFAPSWLAEWLVANVHFQARLFAELTGAAKLAVRLETVDDDGCPRFHVDNVRYRLLCTYRGAGTEWLDPKAIADDVGDGAAPPAAIRRLDRGAIALLRGGVGATPARPGLLHRSPHIEGTGAVRLLLAIDDA